ncbi:MAG: MSMEG_0569 family flavin-dependent oxidoreductase [Cyanobacteria bacterium P01_A01_bin.135]
MTTHYSVAVIGGGQAGLSVSYCLQKRGIDHVVFEANRVAHSWRDKRWDTFCLVTPNWQCTLPGYSYSDYGGADPDGFMPRDQIVDYVESYAKSFNPPLQEGVAVTRLRQSKVFELTTSKGGVTADQVVVATGSYHTSRIPPMAERLPKDILQMHSSEYRNPESLPEGAVLVVGSGQSGCQIAEDLHLAGRQVHLAIGSAPRSPRVYRSKDVVDWLEQMGYYDLPIDQHPDKEKVRSKTNHYLTGRDGGREIDLRQLATEGMSLYGRLGDIEGATLYFKPDLKENLDQADAVAESIKATIDKYIAGQGIEAPAEEPYEPVWHPPEEPLSLDCEAANVTSVIWCIGYGMDFRWVEIPVFDGKGYPSHRRGVSSCDGLYFLGLPWLYTWGSGRFSGVARDAEYIADAIAARKMGVSPLLQMVNEAALGS